MVTICALTEMEPTMTERRRSCAGVRVVLVGDDFVWMAANMSAERDSSDANSSSLQMAAV
jgi:hypothetical protein